MVARVWLTGSYRWADSKTPSTWDRDRPPAEGGWSPGRGNRVNPQPGRMRLKEAETAQANLGRSTVAILWAAYSRYARRNFLRELSFCRQTAANEPD